MRSCFAHPIGKSHLAQAIAHCAVRLEIDVLFFTQTQLFRDLQAARAVGEYDEKFQKLIKTPLRKRSEKYTYKSAIDPVTMLAS